MNKLMLIDSVDESNIQIAIVENGRLLNFFFESNENYSNVGNVYLGRVDHVENSLQAYFIDYGENKNGFLSFFASKDTLVKNQRVIVQVVKDEKGNKGAMLTTFVEIKSIFLIAVLNKNPGCSISKKISSKSDRDLIKSWHENMASEIDCNLIFRHASVYEKYSKIKSDFEKIKKQIACINDHPEKTKVHLLMKAPSIIEKSIIDYYKADMQVYIEGKMFNNTSNYAKRFNQTKPIFKFYEIEDQIESLLHDRVNLLSGGYINIQHTEALTSIDVNSGICKKENSIDKTAFLTNLEAAKEIAYQIRLRDIGGLIVIDFIDMYKKDSMDIVVKEISDSMIDDKAKFNLGELDKFSLFTISRQQLRKNTFLSMHKKCTECNGVGFKRKNSSSSSFILRNISYLIRKKSVDSIVIKCSSELVFYMLNHKKDVIFYLENNYTKKISFENNDNNEVKIFYYTNGISNEYILNNISEKIDNNEFIVKDNKSIEVEEVSKKPDKKISIEYDDLVKIRMLAHENKYNCSFMPKKELIIMGNELIGQI